MGYEVAKKCCEVGDIFFLLPWLQKAVDQSNSYKVRAKYDVMSLSTQVLTKIFSI